MSEFAITRGTGFHMTFANGITISVQFGPGLHADHYFHNPLFSTPSEWSSETAEVAAWDSTGAFLAIDSFLPQFSQFTQDNVVLDFLSTDQVAEIISILSRKEVEG